MKRLQPPDEQQGDARGVNAPVDAHMKEDVGFERKVLTSYNYIGGSALRHRSHDVSSEDRIAPSHQNDEHQDEK
jgi:hypothetical protein